MGIQSDGEWEYRYQDYTTGSVGRLGTGAAEGGRNEAEHQRRERPAEVATEDAMYN